VRFQLTPLQGGEPRHEVLQRDDRGEPFRLFVLPGRYRLDVHPANGELTGTFLRPQTLELEVGAAGGAWTLTAVFGGRIRIAVTDRDGLFVGGHCMLRDTAGHDRTTMWIVREGPHTVQSVSGELLPAGENETAELLEPGDYDLELDLGAHGIQRRRVTVRAREVAEVAIRLP
jgi:hypothetical protein